MGKFVVKQKNLNEATDEKPLQVMVVDGQETFRQKIRTILHNMGGFQVVAEAVSCHRALEIVEHTAIDLVVSDLLLEDGNGAELALRLKQRSPSPHVVIFAATMHDAALLQTILTGVNGYLMKNTPMREIIKAFKNLARGGPALQPRVATTVINLLVERCKLVESGLANIDQIKMGRSRVYSLQASAGTSDAIPAFRELSQPQFSPQEERVLTLLRHGESNKQIAAKLAISPYTVGKHVQKILRKLGATNRTQAAVYVSRAENSDEIVQE